MPVVRCPYLLRTEGAAVSDYTGILSELFIPALRYYLPRHTAAAMTFPSFCKEVWRDVAEADREIAVRDIERELDDGVMWETERAAWREFLRWVEKEKP